MKRLMLCVVGIWILCNSFGLAAAGNPPKPGETLPTFTLPTPENPAQKSYLGLTGDGAFKISEIKARLIIIEIFSMYCPHCQRDAPTVNQLYEKIEADPSLKDAIKLIGIGVGNTPMEVDVYKKRYHVPFPLFPDADYALHKLLGEARTPCFIAVRLDKDRTEQVIHQHVGGLGDVDEFLASITRKSGIAQEK